VISKKSAECESVKNVIALTEAPSFSRQTQAVSAETLDTVDRTHMNIFHPGLAY